MLAMNEAAARILATAAPTPPETLPLHDALDRFAATDVHASVAVPPWDNSAMDGYAVRAVDTGPGASLALTGVVGAGSVGGPVGPGEAVAIMTGAPMPPGADAVVIVEDTDGATEGRVTLTTAVSPDENVRREGGDLAHGDLVVAAGQRLTPARLGLLAAVGHADVQVRVRPRVAVLATGDEIVRPGQPLGPGQIHSSNPYALVGLLRTLGADATDLGDAPDDLEGLVALLQTALHHDAVVTTGGVSVGRFDLVKEAFARLGVDMAFWKVRMKPGKPLAFGTLRRGGHTTALFGLPGNPVSCMVNTHVFVAPWIRACLGMATPFPARVRARMAGDLHERPGRAKLLRVTLESTPDGLLARSTGPQGS
ncbi:MAG: molybdopterin molybdotransferase MoeA, partial [Myxococcales bacterium]|nr:molybdopterin molybdotransferase MoeA [Myxococcales bacterium]